jgi:hypothetical protein
MSSKGTRKSVRFFIYCNFPFIEADSVIVDETSLEFQKAKKILNPYLNRLNQLESTLLFNAFASIIKYFESSKKYYEYMDEEMLSLMGKAEQRYFKMLPKFLQLLKCFNYGIQSW